MPELPCGRRRLPFHARTRSSARSGPDLPRRGFRLLLGQPVSGRCLQAGRSRHYQLRRERRATRHAYVLASLVADTSAAGCVFRAPGRPTDRDPDVLPRTQRGPEVPSLAPRGRPTAPGRAVRGVRGRRTAAHLVPPACVSGSATAFRVPFPGHRPRRVGLSSRPVSYAAISRVLGDRGRERSQRSPGLDQPRATCPRAHLLTGGLAPTANEAVWTNRPACRLLSNARLEIVVAAAYASCHGDATAKRRRARG